MPRDGSRRRRAPPGPGSQDTRLGKPFEFNRPVSFGRPDESYLSMIYRDERDPEYASPLALYSGVQHVFGHPVAPYYLPNPRLAPRAGGGGSESDDSGESCCEEPTPGPGHYDVAGSGREGPAYTMGRR